MPRISVIIPTYNRKDMLLAAIQSVLNQTYKDFEIIVVDDGSTDGTREALNKLDDKRLRYIRHRKNRGVSAALNTGIKTSRGTLIAFLGDDDEYLPNKLERQLKILETSQPRIGLVYTGVLIVDEPGKIIRRLTPSKSHWRGLSHHDFIGGTPLVRKKCFEEVGLFDEDLRYHEDRDMWLRISDKYSFAFVKAPLYKMRVHPGRMASNLDLRMDGLRKLHQKHTFRIESAPRGVKSDIYFRYHCQLAQILLLHISNNTHKARRQSIEAIKLNPFSIEGYKYFVLCLLDRRVFGALYSLFNWGRMMKTKIDRSID